MEMNYKAKIKKLLALAESPVEAEAQAALLKARELMAKHKLSERKITAAKAIGGIRQEARHSAWASLDSRMTWRFALQFSNMLWIAFWRR